MSTPAQIEARRPARPITATLLALAISTVAGCSSYTAYLHIDPAENGPKRLSERQRRDAIAVLEQLLITEFGFIVDPNQTRLQRTTVTSVESPDVVLASFVPSRAVTGQRIAVAAVTAKASRRFAVRIRNLDSEVATPYVNDVQNAIIRAYIGYFPNHEIAVEQLRWGPPRGS